MAPGLCLPSWGTFWHRRAGAAGAVPASGTPPRPPRGCTREPRAGLEEPACVAGCQPGREGGREGSCLQISRRLRHATWMAGPGRGTRAPCCQGAGWKEPGGARPARGVKLPPALVPSPALGPLLQGQVPAKAPSAEVHHPAIRGEMHVGLGAAGPWQGGPGRAWRASLANEPGLLLPVSALTDEQIISPSISLPPLHLCHPRFSPLREDLELVPCSSRQPLPSGQALQQLARAGGILGTALARGDRLRACSPRSASVCPRLGCAFPMCPAASVLFSS